MSHVLWAPPKKKDPVRSAGDRTLQLYKQQLVSIYKKIQPNSILIAGVI